MLSRLALLFVFLLTGFGAEAGTLKGIALANHLGGAPFSQVKVSATGANPTETGESGSFTLQFPNAQPGDPVQVTINKPGYVVVNYVQLRAVLPKNADAEPLTLLLCKETEREEWTRQLYRLKSVDAVEQTYKVRVKQLEDSNQQNATAMAKLREERDQARAAAEKAADELARLKPGDTTDLYAEAMSFFLKGKVQEALQVLDEQKLRESIEDAKKRKAEADKAVDNAVQGYLLKARLLTTQFQFAHAEKVYESAIQAAPDNRDAHFAFGKFSQNLNHFSEARREYVRALEISRSSGSQRQVASALNNLGVLDKDQNRMPESRQHLDEALTIRRQLSQGNTGTDLSDLAATLNNLGIVDEAQNRLAEARRHFEEALNIYLPYMAGALQGLGLVDFDQNHMAEARQYYEEALRIYRQLARQNPETNQPLAAGTLNKLGLVEFDQNQPVEARQHYEEALKIYRQSMQQIGESHLVDVAATLNNLGILDQTQNRMPEARQHFEEALKIRRQLAGANPETNLPYVAQVLINLGNLDKAQNLMEEARQNYEQALKVRRELALHNPDMYLPAVAQTLNSLVDLDTTLNRTKEAGTYFQELISINQELYERQSRAEPVRRHDCLAAPKPMCHAF